MKVSPGRVAAAKALLDSERGHLDEALARHRPARQDDAGLAWHLALGVLRHRGQLDARVRELARKQVDPKALVALRIGIFELHFGRAPAHAVVDQAVELTRALGAPHAAGFVNALMRKAGAPLPAVSNHPEWLVKRWRERWGAAFGPEAEARLDSPPPLAICGAPPPGARPIEPEGCFLLDDAGRVEALEGFAEGRFWVMDPAAARVADLAEAAPGKRILDACAAPGGKSMRLASHGAQVVATDRAHRLGPLRENVARTRLSIEVVERDWTREGADLGLFDAVLVDAPCTGLGTTRRHPEIRWSRMPSDPAAMALRQLPVLEAASAAVAPGGLLVYAVCSAEPEEGRGVAEAFLAAHDHFQRVDELWTIPGAGDEDGFYAAKMRRA